MLELCDHAENLTDQHPSRIFIIFLKHAVGGRNHSKASGPQQPDQRLLDDQTTGDTSGVETDHTVELIGTGDDLSHHRTLSAFHLARDSILFEPFGDHITRQCHVALDALTLHVLAEGVNLSSGGHTKVTCEVHQYSAANSSPSM